MTDTIDEGEDAAKGGAGPGKMTPDQPKTSGLASTLETIALPLTTLSSLLTMQDVEDHKPRLSKMSWLPDVLVFRSSILPTIIIPALVVTGFSAAVAAASIWWDKEVGLSNNVVPLLSVVVGLLLVFRNSSAYERYTEGRKDFTTLISNARNLSRLIWVVTTLPPTTPGGEPKPVITRQELTEEKKKLIRLIVAFAMAVKHHLRAEGGVHHDDLRGLLPTRLAGSSIQHLKQASAPITNDRRRTTSPGRMSPSSPNSLLSHSDEESSLGLRHRTPLQHSQSQQSSLYSPRSPTSHLRPRHQTLKRRPTAVRVIVPDAIHSSSVPRGRQKRKGIATERTPLINPGVRPDLRKSVDDAESSSRVLRRAEVGLGRMVELGLPLIIAHEISRTIFRFRRMGYLENVGPAGVNAMQGLVQSMTDQLGAMERVQTPMPYIIAVHMKQATTMLLFVLPFTLVDILGLKMIPLMFFIALIYMGIEGIAAQVEMPFGNDPCDLNLDLYCTELLCECEAILERLPEGDEDDEGTFWERSSGQTAEDDEADDDGDDGGE